MHDQPDHGSKPSIQDGCAAPDQGQQPASEPSGQQREPTPMPGLAKGDRVRRPIRPANEPGGDGDF